jgi:hypothetical protein
LIPFFFRYRCNFVGIIYILLVTVLHYFPLGVFAWGFEHGT